MIIHSLIISQYDYYFDSVAGARGGDFKVGFDVFKNLARVPYDNLIFTFLTDSFTWFQPTKTYNKDFPNKHIIPVNDHINKTGINPIINNNQIKAPQFQDISRLYKTIKGVTTTCCGEKINYGIYKTLHGFGMESGSFFW